MSLFGNRQAIGIDIGSASTKAVVLRLDNNQPQIAVAETLDTGAEGILNENELHASVAHWLREAPWAKGHQALGLPQCLSTTQIADFPAIVNDNLEEMVRFETQQLAGLSDELFIHDYQVLPPGQGRRNPVLIGLCRESVVRERIHNLTAAGLHPTVLGMNGIASLNALLFLHPELKQETLPHVLLDVGQDSTLIVVFCGTRPLYTGSLDFSSHMLAEALLDRVGGDPAKAESRKREMDVNDAGPGSPVRELLLRLDSEFENALDHWRAQQPPEFAEEPCKNIWLCGGGSRQLGLPEYLGDRYECQGIRFGPPDPARNGQPMPEYAAALGLALMGTGHAEIGISLMPAEMKWALQRQRRLPWLVVALVLTALALATLVASALARSRRMLGEQVAYAEELSACDQFITRIRRMQAGIAAHEAKIVPLVEIGSRGRRFLRSLDDLAGMTEEGSWLAYLGDELAYEAGKKSPPSTTRRGENRTAQGTGIFGDVRMAGDLPDEFPELRLALATPRLEALILVAYAPFVVTEPHGALTRLKAKLDQLEHYRQVDALSTLQQMGRNDIAAPWDAFLLENPDVRYNSFALRLPFASLPVAIPEATEASP